MSKLFFRIFVKQLGNPIAHEYMFKYIKNRPIISWLLLLVYVPMMIVVTFHQHSETLDTVATIECKDCQHHVRHDGHLLALQHSMHDCALCQWQSNPYLLPSLVCFIAFVGLIFIIHTLICPKCKQPKNDVRNTRSPPYNYAL